MHLYTSGQNVTQSLTRISLKNHIIPPQWVLTKRLLFDLLNKAAFEFATRYTHADGTLIWHGDRPIHMRVLCIWSFSIQDDSPIFTSFIFINIKQKKMLQFQTMFYMKATSLKYKIYSFWPVR